MCEAIELHYERRLQELLHEPGVYYADTFWAPAPRARFQRVARRDEHVSWEYHTNVGEAGAPKDLRESCGHMRIDAELRARIDVDQRFYLLVSLVQVAVEHTDDSDDGFNPLQILADSGKIDLSEPLMYHQPAFHTDCIMDVRLEPTTGVVKGATYTIPEPVFPAPKIEGPLVVYKVNHCIEQPLLVHYKPVQYPIASRKILQALLSARSYSPEDAHLIGFLASWGGYITQYSGALYALLEQSFFRPEEKLFQDVLVALVDTFQLLLNAGLDVNRPLQKSLYSYNTLEGTWKEESEALLYKLLDRFVQFIVYRPLAADLPSHAASVERLVRLLLASGISSFASGSGEEQPASLLLQLFSRRQPYYECRRGGGGWGMCRRPPLENPVDERPEHTALKRGVALQLLALGFGRRELSDEHFSMGDLELVAVRKVLVDLSDEKKAQVAEAAAPAEAGGEEESSGTEDLYYCDELRRCVDRFDAGPLSLRQLTRIAVRRAIGGAYFSRHVATLKLPKQLLDYVLCACDELDSALQQ